MTWLAIGGIAWLALALTVALVAGRGIRLADDREAATQLPGQVDEFLRIQSQRLVASAVPPPPAPRTR